jgi:hypothetical protein
LPLFPASRINFLWIELPQTLKLALLIFRHVSPLSVVILDPDVPVDKKVAALINSTHD